MMRPTLLVLALAALLAAAGAPPAIAKRVAPPGNSGVDQYVEVVPDREGGRPAGSVGDGRRNRRGGGGVDRRTARRLGGAGADGSGALAFANATAPTTGAGGGGSPAGGESGPSSSGESGSTGSGDGGGGRPGAADDGSQEAGGVGAADQEPGNEDEGGGLLETLFNAMLGGSGGPGLGLLLPVILGVITLAGVVALLVARARPSGTGRGSAEGDRIVPKS